MAAALSKSRGWRIAAIWVLAIVVFCWLLPPFHIRPLDARSSGASAEGAALDAAQSARKLWDQLVSTQDRAVDVTTLLTALKSDPRAAEQSHGRRIGHGGPAFYFVRGTGRVVESTRKGVVLEIAGHATRVVLITGPVFGNSLRDATPLVEIGDFDSFQFNALSTELNLLSERQVQPRLADLNQPGASIRFVGGARIARRGGALEVVPIDVGSSQ